MTPAGQTSTELPVAGSALAGGRRWKRAAASRPRRIASSSTPVSRSRDAAALIPYLHALGITDCYCSSYLQAVAGSLHGYDVADPTALNPEVGTEDDFRRFVATLSAHGMGQVLDVVPNHMGIARSREPLVAGRARERPQLAVREDLRHRLAAAEARARLQGAAADPRRPVRHGAGARRDPPCIPGWRVLSPLLRNHAARGAAIVRADPPPPRRRADARPRRRASGSDRAAQHHHEPRTPAAARRAGPGAPGRTAAREGGGQAAAGRARATQRGRRRPSSRRTCGCSMGSPACRPASTCSTRCSATRPTASHIGAWPRKRSTTAASSTSTSSPPCGWRTRRSSRRRTAWCSGCCASGRSPGCGSITSTGSTIPATTCGVCRPARANSWQAAAISRSSSSSRRSSRRTNRCRRAGRLMGRPGTSSQTR